MDYTYPLWSKWRTLTALTHEQVKAFLPDFDGEGFLNKGVVIPTETTAYTEWVRQRELPRSFHQEPPIVDGIIAVYKADDEFFLIAGWTYQR